MRINPRTALILVTICCSQFLLKAQTDTGIIADGVTPQLISRNFKFTEGPATDKEGNIYFTDQPNNKIWIYKTNGSLTLFLDSAGRSNGLYFDKKGNLLSCVASICKYGFRWHYARQ